MRQHRARCAPTAEGEARARDPVRRTRSPPQHQQIDADQIRTLSILKPRTWIAAIKMFEAGNDFGQIGPAVSGGWFRSGLFRLGRFQAG
eukprot:1210079-Prymnesium_polylepis.1